MRLAKGILVLLLLHLSVSVYTAWIATKLGQHGEEEAMEQARLTIWPDDGQGSVEPLIEVTLTYGGDVEDWLDRIEEATGSLPAMPICEKWKTTINGTVYNVKVTTTCLPNESQQDCQARHDTYVTKLKIKFPEN